MGKVTPDRLHLRFHVRQDRLGLIEDHPARPPRLVGPLVAAAAAQPLDQGRDRGVFADEQVAVEIEGKLADLGRDPEDRGALRAVHGLEGGDDFRVAVAAVAELESAVVAQDRRTSGRRQPVGPPVVGELEGEPLGLIDPVDDPEHAQPRPQGSLDLARGFILAGDRPDRVSLVVGGQAEPRGVAAEGEAVDDGQVPGQVGLAALDHRGGHGQDGQVEVLQELHQRGEHPAVVAVDLVEHQGRVGQQRQQARRAVVVLQEGQELVDGGREDPLGPLPEREQPGVGVPLRGRDVGLDVLQVEVGRAVDERGQLGAGVGGVLAATSAAGWGWGATTGDGCPPAMIDRATPRPRTASSEPTNRYVGSRNATPASRTPRRLTSVIIASVARPIRRV